VHDIASHKYLVIQHGKTKGSMTTIPVPNLDIDLLKDIQGFHLIVESKVDKTLFNNTAHLRINNCYMLLS